MSGAGHRKIPFALLDSVRAGDTLSLARAITEIENASVAGVELGLAVQELGLRTATLGVTGPPGAGKSSLINALISELLPRFARIGVLTVDPSSPVSGGAVLGDRVRMAAHSANAAVFIRSLSARGHLGGVTRTTRKVIDLMAAGGMKLVIVETVGTGQSEVEIAELTGVKLVVCAPGMGDEMQAIKAGVLEVADLLVVNKADLPDADRTVHFLRSMLMHRGDAEHRVALKVSTLRREGLALLADVICDRLKETSATDTIAAMKADTPQGGLARDAAELIMAMIRESTDPATLTLAKAAASGAMPRRDAARKAIALLARGLG